MFIFLHQKSLLCFFQQGGVVSDPFDKFVPSKRITDDDKPQITCDSLFQISDFKVGEMLKPSSSWMKNINNEVPAGCTDIMIKMKEKDERERCKRIKTSRWTRGSVVDLRAAGLAGPPHANCNLIIIINAISSLFLNYHHHFEIIIALIMKLL